MQSKVCSEQDRFLLIFINTVISWVQEELNEKYVLCINVCTQCHVFTTYIWTNIKQFSSHLIWYNILKSFYILFSYIMHIFTIFMQQNSNYKITETPSNAVNNCVSLVRFTYISIQKNVFNNNKKLYYKSYNETCFTYLYNTLYCKELLLWESFSGLQLD